MSLESFKETYDFVHAKLKTSGELGQITSYEELSTKTLIIAAAGQLEKDITKLLIDMPRKHNSPEFVGYFVVNQALKRKYHTLFDWDAKKVNSFAGLFGSIKKKEIVQACSEDESTEDFFYIGSERNRIVHKGLASESVDKTFVEVWEIYISAQKFVTKLKDLLH